MIAWRKRNPPNNKVEATAAVKNAQHALVIQLGGMEAFVQSLAAAKRIRDFHVGARIALLTTERTRELAEKCPYFDTVEADGKPTEAQAITKLIARIRAAKYDMVYDLEGSSRTGNYFQGLRPWPPRWSGPVAGASHRFVDNNRGQTHPLDRYAAQLQTAGISVAGDFVPELNWVRSALRDPPRLQADFFGIRGRYVLMLPRGSDADANRRWAQEKYVELARRLVRRGVTPVVLGGPEDRPIGATIAAAEPGAKNLVTRADLFQCVGLAERAALALGDDVELMHIAAAAGTPCVTFLSALARPEEVAPRGKGGVVALTASVIADLPVEQVERQLRNCGAYPEHAASA
ncbi:MAG: glycosyltransferase family 9 protein [Proteobacteria bacterium]|nr:glycosyltransferase family 9 protein [Pseudomonadota bacterium]